MKKFIYSILAMLIFSVGASATESNDTINKTLDEVTVNGIYRNNINNGSLVKYKDLTVNNHGQGIDYVLSNLPSIYAYNDNGTHIGYTYMRIRGMGQERMNVTIDGMPWNDAEDYGCYFVNSPDMVSSMHSIKVEKGASVTNNGTAAYAGNVSLETVDLQKDTDSYTKLTYGSFNSSKITTVYNMGQKGHWGLHLRGSMMSTDGAKEHCYHNSEAFAMKIGYFFNENHTVDWLSINGFHRNGQGFMGITEDELPSELKPFRQMKSGNRQQETDNFLMLINKIQYKGKMSDKLYFTYSLYWNHLKGDYRIGWDDPTTETGKVLNNYDLIQHMYGVNAVMKVYPTTNLSFIFGVNASMFKRQHKGYDIANTDTIINIWHSKDAKAYYNNTGRKPEVNTFLTAKWSPFSNFNVSGNLQCRNTSLSYHVAQPSAYSVDDKDIDIDWDFLNYGVNIEYSPINNSKVYFRYAVTNREPSRSDMFGAEYYQGEMLATTDSERVNDFELGYDIENNTINFNANLFYMDFKNELMATGELSPMNFLPLHTQHDAYRYGLELAVDYRPIKNLHIIANTAWSENRLNDTKRYLGNRISTFSPSFTAFGEINYTHRNVKYGVNSHYRSDMYMDIENLHKLKSLFTLGAYINARFNKYFEAGLNFDNITNRMNFSNGTVDGNTAYYLVDSPFNMFASLTVHF